MRFLIKFALFLLALIGVSIWAAQAGYLPGGSILQGLGIAALVIVGLVLLGIVWFVWKVVRLVRTAAQQPGSSMAARISLIADDSESTHPQEVSALRSHFQALGFKQSGEFRVDELQGIRLSTWVKPDEEMAAAIYDHATFGVFYDVTAIDHQGYSFTVTTSPLSHPENVPPRCQSIIAVGLPVQEAVRRMRAERPEGNWRDLDVQDIPNAIEEAYARSMDFQIRKGTISEAYVRQIASITNPGMKLTEEQIAKVISNHEAGLRGLIEEACIANFLKTKTLSADEWERVRGSILVVHDRMSTEEVKALVEEYIGDDTQAKSPRQQIPPQELFFKYLEKYRLLTKFKPLGAVESPIPARLFQVLGS